MNRTRYLAAFTVLLALPFLPTLPLIHPSIDAEEDHLSLVIAPPPVGYPVLEKGAKTSRAGGNFVYLSLDVQDSDITLMGGSVFADRQYCPTEWLALDGSTGGTLLGGNKYDMLMLQVPIAGTAIARVLHFPAFSLFAFAGAGANFGLTNMTVTIPQPVPYTSAIVDDDTSLTSLSATVTGSGGLQANIATGPFIISPFGLLTVTGGRYSSTMESSMSYDYPSDSGTLDAVTATVLGFDVLHRPSGVSLSSQLRSTKRYTMITLALRFLLGR